MMLRVLTNEQDEEWMFHHQWMNFGIFCLTHVSLCVRQRNMWATLKSYNVFLLPQTIPMSMEKIKCIIIESIPTRCIPGIDLITAWNLSCWVLDLKKKKEKNFKKIFGQALILF